MRCVCCGRFVTVTGLRMDGGKVHFDCWDEHHSDPTGPWPRDHVCAKEAQ